MYLVTWDIRGQWNHTNGMLVRDEDASEHVRDIRGFHNVFDVRTIRCDALDISRVAVPTEEHDRIVAAKDAQIAALEANIDELVRNNNAASDAHSRERRALESRPRVCVVGLVTDPSDRVLLIKHRKRGTWELPGGKHDRAETWRDALRREMAEETGLTVTIIGEPTVLDGVPVNGAGYHSVILVAHCRAEGQPWPGDDADAAAWFTRDEIPWDDLSKIGSAEIVRQWADAQEPRPVYYCCPGEPKPCIGSGISTRERACPNCGQECVPYPSPSNLAAAENRPRVGDPIVRKAVRNAGE